MTFKCAEDPLSFLDDVVIDEHLALFQQIPNFDAYREAKFYSLSAHVLFRFIKDSHIAHLGRDSWPRQHEDVIKALASGCVLQRSHPTTPVRLSFLNLGAAFGVMLMPRLNSVLILEKMAANAYQSRRMMSAIGVHTFGPPTHGDIPATKVLDFPVQTQLKLCHQAAWKRVHEVALRAAREPDQLATLILHNEKKHYMSPEELLNVLKPLGVTDDLFVSLCSPPIRREFLERSLRL